MQGGYPSQSCWGCRFAVDVIEKLKFHTVLDAGTGNGALTRLMREHSKSAFGIELSRAVLEKVRLVSSQTASTLSGRVRFTRVGFTGTVVIQHTSSENVHLHPWPLSTTPDPNRRRTP